MRIKIEFCFTLIFVFWVFVFVFTFFWNSGENVTGVFYPDKRFIHSKEQIRLTKNIVIDQDQCDNTKQIAIFIPSLPQVSGKYFMRRQQIRDSWVTDFKELGVSVYFVLGLNENLDQLESQQLRQEAEEYKDILQFAFIDSYFNLTLKTISILQWAEQKCKNTKFILKADDDVVVNVPLLMNNLDSFKPGIHGIILEKSEPNRNVTNKWFIPPEYYPHSILPRYIKGCSYLLTWSSIPRLLSALNKFNGFVLIFEDIFITGIIAEKAGVQRHDSTLIRQIDCQDVCALDSIAVAFECTAQEIIDLWSKLKDNHDSSCKNRHLALIFILLLVIICIILCLLFVTAKCIAKSRVTRSNIMFKKFRYH